MALNIPSFRQIKNLIRADVTSYLPELDPTISNSVIKALVDSLAGRMYDFFKLVEQLEKELFPQTATSEYLERWGNYEALTRNPATVSNGPIVISGSGTIPVGTEFTTADGNLFTTDIELTLAENEIEITSLTRSGYTVTATTVSDHNLASNIYVTISGATETDYNGEYQIVVTDSNEFTYTITGLPSTPADTTANIYVTFEGGIVDVTSSDTGEDQNIEAGGLLSLTSPISGVEMNAYVGYDEISGGTDAENDSDFRSRILQSRSNPIANFNSAAIEKIALTVEGVTRVFVKEITPEVGDVTIYFVKDNEDNIIPTSTDVANVKEEILTIKPAHTSDDSIYVYAPTAVTVNFTFTALNPDTSTMRTAIENNLIAFFQDNVTLDEDITEDKYRAAIIDTVDPSTGDQLLSFTLSTPSTDISISDGEIGILGTVSFSI